MVYRFNAYCPCADVCQRGGKSLGTYYSEAECRAALVHHLQASSYRYLSAPEVDEVMDAYTVEPWLEDTDDEAAPAPKAGAAVVLQPTAKAVQPTSAGSSRSASVRRHAVLVHAVLVVAVQHLRGVLRGVD